MSNQGNPTVVTTGQVRLSYVHLFAPYANQPGQDPKYSATILLPKSDIATKQRMDAAINVATQMGVSSKWNGVRPPQIKNPIWDGDGVRQSGERFGPECKGCWVITASSNHQQAIVDLNMNPIINQSEIYSGMYARVNMNFFPFLNSGNKGVGCGLGPVQKIGDGEPLGGHMSAEAAFGDNASNVYVPAGPVYQAPAYQAPVQNYAPPVQQYNPPVYQQQPTYAPPAQPIQQPNYAQPTYVQPTYPQPMQQPGQPMQFDPITGKPVIGGVMGI